MNRTSISDLKAKAKDQLLGNYGMATGSFALLFVILYAIMSIIMSAFTLGLVRTNPAMFATGITGQLISQILGMVVGTLSVVFSVGYLQILRKISKGETAQLSDLFHVFKNHPDKVIIVSLILTGAQFVLLLPATFVMGGGFFAQDSLELDGKRFLLWVILYIAGFAVSFVIDLMLAMCFLIYLDDPETEVSQILSKSVSMMRGNKFRYFYMTLSFLGYWLLIILSFGIAMLWVVPYQTMTSLEFYYDLKEGTGDEFYEL